MKKFGMSISKLGRVSAGLFLDFFWGGKLRPYLIGGQ